MIRRATIEDKDRLVEMATRFILESRYQEFLTPIPERIGALIDQVLEVGVIWVGTIDAPDQQLPNGERRHRWELERIVGMLAIVGPLPHLLTYQTYAEEVCWWVDPEARKTLIGPRLMHNMECWVRENRIDMVKMFAPSDSTVGDFYSKCGYQAVETAWVKVFSY